jgi:hypothetical protein
MASERTGIACEVLVALAAERPPLRGSCVCEHQPDVGARVAVPDFRLKRTRGRRDTFLQITYAGAKPDSQRKFWRNFGELQELKTLGTQVPRVVSVTFGSAYLNYVPAVYKAGWDAALFCDEFHERLLSLVFDVAGHGGETFEEKLQYARDRYATHAAVLALSSALALALDVPLLNSGLWSAHRAAASVSVERSEPRNTSVRRGIAKMLIARPPTGVLSKPVDVEPASLRELIGLGIVAESMVGPRLVDPEALNAVAAVKREGCARVIASAPLERMRGWLHVIWGVADVAARAHDWAAMWSDLSERVVYEKLLKAAKEAPPDRQAFIALLELIKGALGRQAIGAREVLLRAIERREHTKSTLRAYADLLGRAPRLRDLETVRLGLQSVLSPGGRQAFALTPDDIARVAVCLYLDFIQRVPASRVRAVAKEIAAELLATYFDVKVATYRDFDPLGVLLRDALRRSGIAFTECNVCSGFAMKASAEGAHLDPRATATEVIRAGKSTVVNWLAVTDDGRDHKRKELCGKAVAIRYRWQPAEAAFAADSAQRLLLLVDGTWRSEDLEAMRRAGWNEIFYPDEMDKLVKAIV